MNKKGKRIRIILFLSLLSTLTGNCYADNPVAERPIYSAGDY
jgi:hypothetical protein